MEINIKDGYKVTEVGVIPDDWEVRIFDNITKLITCGIAATPKYVAEQIGKPFLSAQNVQNGKVVYNNYKYISHQLFNQITKYSKPKKGDLLYTRVGAGIGEAGVIEDDFEFGIYVSLTLIRTDENQLYSYFLLHLLNSPTYKSIAKNGQFAGGGVQNLNVQIVKQFFIPLPPLAEQKAIAHALSDVDNLITAIDQLITKKRNIKQGTMQELLTGKKRLPGFSGKWEVKIFKDVSFVNQGLQIEIQKRLKQPIQNSKKYITIQFLNNGKEVEYINNYSSSVCCNEDDVLMTRTGNTGIVISGVSGVFHNNFFKINFDRKILDKNYLIGYLNLEETQKLILAKAGTSTIPDLNHNDFYSIPIPLPPLPEQKAISEILNDIDKEIEALEKKRDKYKALKQGMMQELLTGKTRIIDN